MTDRIVDISEGGARLHVRYSQLVIEREGQPEVTTPLNELGVLLLSHPRVELTQSVIAGLAENGGSLVVCDGKLLPTAMVLPLQANTLQTERMAAQVGAPLPLRKQLWKQIVQAKIRAQGRLLRELHASDGGLLVMAERVRSGDAGHHESQASRIYWPLLFRDPKFRRGRDYADQNAHLNYGYAVLRAIVARAVAAAGLHPSIGLQHHNRYDQFCLANDLMEPYRPIVDRAVYQWVQDHDPAQPLDKLAKAALLRPLLARFEHLGEERTLFDLAGRTVASLLRALEGSKPKLEFAEV